MSNSPITLTNPIKIPLTLTTIRLHWLVALVMIGLLITGLTMKYLEVWLLYPIHKSVGVLALILIIPRILFRLTQGWPTPDTDLSSIQHLLARSVQWLLLIASIAMPISGMILSGASGHGFGIFGFSLVPPNYSTINPDLVVPYSEFWTSIGYALHSWIAYILIATLTLHIAGALKHHFVDKDTTLRRMLNK